MRSLSDEALDFFNKDSARTMARFRASQSYRYETTRDTNKLDEMMEDSVRLARKRRSYYDANNKANLVYLYDDKEDTYRPITDYYIYDDKVYTEVDDLKSDLGITGEETDGPFKEFGDGKDSYDDLMEMSIAADMNSSSTTSTSGDDTDGPFDENEEGAESNESDHESSESTEGTDRDDTTQETTLETTQENSDENSESENNEGVSEPEGTKEENSGVANPPAIVKEEATVIKKFKDALQELDYGNRTTRPTVDQDLFETFKKYYGLDNYSVKETMDGLMIALLSHTYKLEETDASKYLFNKILFELGGTAELEKNDKESYGELNEKLDKVADLMGQLIRFNKSSMDGLQLTMLRFWLDHFSVNGTDIARDEKKLSGFTLNGDEYIERLMETVRTDQHNRFTRKLSEEHRKRNSVN
jgi:hypothetical protein